MKKHTFPKSEHLCLQRETEMVFAAGRKSCVAYPVRLVWHEVSAEAGKPRARVLLSVAKRRLRHAVDRNRAKRQLREAYRLNKEILAPMLDASPDKAYLLALVWLADQPQLTRTVQRSVHVLLHQAVEKQQRAAQSPSQPSPQQS